LGWIEGVSRPTRAPERPTVLTPQEVAMEFSHMEGKHALFAKLLYGTGMRLMECAQLHVKDVDLLFERRLGDALWIQVGHTCTSDMITICI
jgi:integrase